MNMGEHFFATGGSFLVDDEDDALVVALGCVKYGDYVGYRPDGQRNMRMLHRRLLGLSRGDLHVDHINGDPRDNRKSNLRLATKAENAQNSKLPTTNTSGFKGVSWHKRSQKWEVTVRKDNIIYYGGSFSCLKKASDAAKELRLKLHQQFARHR